MNWRFGRRHYDLTRRVLVMGILNVTPDSFSDGGQFRDTGAAVERGLRMTAEGADLIDVGGESTRPGSEPVAADEQIRRVVPVIRELAARGSAPISIDTTRAEVARAALEAGAEVINDISALRDDAGMAPLAAQAGCGMILMHMQGTPRTMQAAPSYDDPVAEIAAFLNERTGCAICAGVAPEAVALDPGIGFGKTHDHNLELFRRMDELSALGPDESPRPLLIGASRKMFLRRIVGQTEPPVTPEVRAELIPANVAAATLAILRGARILRVHDVAETVRAARVAEAALKI